MKKKLNYFITGGTGSFSKKFIQNLVKINNFNKIIIFSRDEFKQEKLKELDFIKESLLRKNLSGTDSTQGALKTLEDGADTMEKESLSQLAGRQQKFISNLEKALIELICFLPALIFSVLFKDKRILSESEF